MTAYCDGKANWSPPTRTDLSGLCENYTAGLSFPCKVLFDSRTGFVSIADSGRHRIIIAGRDASVKKIIGCGRAGKRDGSFAEAEFNCPRGMAFFRGKLYIADTGNHLLRLADFATGEVLTVAGAGAQLLPGGYHQPDRADFSSPWDLVTARENIYVAMAGTNQIWELEPQRTVIKSFAGTGMAGLRDGDLKTACFSRPSGLTTDLTGNLYCADANTSSIRRISLDTGRVETLAVSGLFYSQDGTVPAFETPLRHPLGVAWDSSGSKLFVADSGNNRVVALDPDRKNSLPLDQELNNPGGLTVFDEGLLVADTNSHRIVKIAGEIIAEFRLEWPEEYYNPINYCIQGRFWAAGCSNTAP